jgi:tungstate transport system substrate-binding protein
MGIIGCKEARLKLATTTSVENSGILEVLLSPFEKRHNIKVDVIVAGTGRALALSKNGDADAVIVHCPHLEERFLKEGFGVERREIMFNWFILVGPSEDPAGVKEEKDILSCFSKIAEREHTFVSRGDGSGTEKKEKSIWKAAGIRPEGKWYLETGQGMGATLLIADQKSAYCLSDYGTYLYYKSKERIELSMFSLSDPLLYNPYSIIATNPKIHPNISYNETKRLIDWLTSEEAQTIIAEYKVFGKRLFEPISRSSPKTSPLSKEE